MIHLTRLNGPGFVLNPDLIQKAEATPDTVVTLVDGTKYVVAESVELLSQRVRAHRASVVALAQQLAIEPPGDGDLPPADADDELADAIPLRPYRRP